MHIGQGPWSRGKSYSANHRQNIGSTWSPKRKAYFNSQSVPFLGQIGQSEQRTIAARTNLATGQGPPGIAIEVRLKSFLLQL